MKFAAGLLASILIAAPGALAQTITKPDDIQGGTHRQQGDAGPIWNPAHGLHRVLGNIPRRDGNPRDRSQGHWRGAARRDRPVESVSTTNADLDGKLVSDMFFDAKTHPTMHFVSTRVVRTGERTAKVTGNLTLHGVTKPVDLDVTFNGAGPNHFTKVATLGFKGEGVLRRSDFGLGKFVPIVSDETTISISVAFEKH